MEDVRDADARLDVGRLQRIEPRHQEEGSAAAVLLRNRAPGTAHGDHFTQVQLLDKRDDAEQEAVEIVLVETRQPAV